MWALYQYRFSSLRDVFVADASHAEDVRESSFIRRSHELFFEWSPFRLCQVRDSPTSRLLLLFAYLLKVMIEVLHMELTTSPKIAVFVADNSGRVTEIYTRGNLPPHDNSDLIDGRGEELNLHAEHLL